jgi:hypothetical protein
MASSETSVDDSLIVLIPSTDMVLKNDAEDQDIEASQYDKLLVIKPILIAIIL